MWGGSGGAGLRRSLPGDWPLASVGRGGREKGPETRLVAAARELRDRYLEHVNGGELELASRGKYDVACGQLAKEPRKTRLLMNRRAA
jgi:hypothetical protein